MQYSFSFNCGKKILYCANCGCAQLKEKCTKRTIAKTLFIKDEERISLTIFEDKLVALYNMYKPNDKVKEAKNFREEDITELLLSVEATIFYNKKFNITSIKAKKD